MPANGTQGNSEEAEELYLRVIAIQEKTFGPHHAQLVTSFNNMANVLQAQVMHLPVWAHACVHARIHGGDSTFSLKCASRDLYQVKQ